MERQAVGDEALVRICADRFTRMVRVEGDLDGLTLDDNYFDLEPGRPQVVRVRGLNAPEVSIP